MTAVAADARASTEALLAAVTAAGLPGADPRGALPTAPLDEAAWRRLLSRANHQRVVGLLAHAVESGALAVTDEQHDELAALHARAMAVALELDARLLDAAGALAGADVDFRVLKGAAAAHLDYPEPSQRQYGDVDLLVASAALGTAERALVGLGYPRQTPSLGARFEQRFAKTVELASPDRWEIDVHRTLALEPFGLTIPEDDLLAGVDEFALGGRALPALDAPRRLVHAAVHGSLGNWPPRLVPHRDLAALALGVPDPAPVVALAERWGLGAVLADAVTRTWALFDLDPAHPLAAWAAARVPSRGERVALAAFQRRDRRQRHRSIATLRVVPGARRRLAYARDLAFPDRGHLDARGVSQLAWLRRAVRRRGGRR